MEKVPQYGHLLLNQVLARVALDDNWDRSPDRSQFRSSASGHRCSHGSFRLVVRRTSNAVSFFVSFAEIRYVLEQAFCSGFFGRVRPGTNWQDDPQSFGVRRRALLQPAHIHRVHALAAQGGTVEGGVRYVKRNALAGRGEELVCFEDYLAFAPMWRDQIANVRIHATTRERPVDRFQQERPLPRPLPAVPFDTDEVVPAVVSPHARIEFDGNRYSVPPHFARQPVTVRASRELARVLHEGQVIAHHPRCCERGQLIVSVDHRLAALAMRKRSSATEREQAFDALGPEARQFHLHLKSQPKLSKALKVYLRPSLLLLDELGYLPIDKRGADLLFQVVAARYERGSIVLTTNRAFRGWGTLFDADNTVATALIDRLMHHGEALVIQGDSYRMRDKGSDPTSA